MSSEPLKDFLKELEIKDPEQIRLWDEYGKRKKTLDINMLIFHDFEVKKVRWRDLFYWYEDCCHKLNITPTRLGVEGIDGRPYNYYRDKKTLTYKGGKRKLEKFNFNEKMYSLYITCMYHEKSYTSDFMSLLSVSSSEEAGSGQMYAKLFFEESLYPFSITKYQELASIMHEFTGAKYGYYYQLKLGMRPGLYATGSHQCAPKDDKIEQRKLAKWDEVYIRSGSPNIIYILQKDGKLGVKEVESKLYKYKLGDLRQIYNLNFLSTEHLTREVSKGVTLEQWIKSSNKHGKLNELKPDFWSWEVAQELITPVTEALASSGIILCL